MIELAIVTDEVSADLETALELITDWGVNAVELRGVESYRVPDMDAFWQKRLRTLLRDFGVEVVALSPGLFKIPFYTDDVRPDQRILRWEDKAASTSLHERNQKVDYHLNTLLPRSLEIAAELGAGRLVVFSFDRPHGDHGPIPEAVIEALRASAERAAETNVMLCIEVEHICWGNTGAATADLVRRVDHPNLRINWDPANALKAGEEPFPEGYSEVAEYVSHVHFKDAAFDGETGQVEWSMQGDVDWVGQIAALKANGYLGYISVESHCLPKVAAAKATLERVRCLVETGQDTVSGAQSEGA
jgi:sugar phosphate isomerase/epimerase